MTITTLPIQRIRNSTTWPSIDAGHIGRPAVARLIVALLLALGLWLVAAPPLAAATTVPSVESPPGGADVVATSVLAGQVLIGPTCPLARPNPPPGCEDRPYQASISIQTPDGTQEVARIETDEQGLFSIELSPGDYLVVPLT